MLITSPTRQQSGMSLIELMIAMSLSLVVSLAMVTLMANTLGSGATTISMARLTQEMRASMLIMSRELRRANYHANFAKCFGNASCVSTLDDGNADASGYIKAVTVGGTGNSCFYFWYDRDADGDVTDDDDVAAFRRTTVTIGGTARGVVQMNIASNTLGGCTATADWVQLTDPEVVDITDLDFDNSGSYTDTVLTGITQRVEKIQINMDGRLVSDNNITREIQDTIRVRNDIFTVASP